MSFTITIDWIIEILITGLAISVAAFLLPFVYVRNFGHAVLVGVLITLVSAAIYWLLGAVGIRFSPASSLAVALINFLIYVVSILGVDALLKSFRVNGFLMAVLFAVIVAVMKYFITVVLAAIF